MLVPVALTLATQCMRKVSFSLACMYTRYVLLLIVLLQSMVSMSIISIMLALATVTSTALLDSFNNYEK